MGGHGQAASQELKLCIELGLMLRLRRTRTTTPSSAPPIAQGHPVFARSALPLLQPSTQAARDLLPRAHREDGLVVLEPHEAVRYRELQILEHLE